MKKLVSLGLRVRAAMAGFGAVLILAACGGGGGSGGDTLFPGNGGNGATPASLVDISVAVDKPTVPDSGAETVTVTVTALGAGNAALTGVTVPVAFEVDPGAVVTAAATTTNTATGRVAATVTLVDKSRRKVTVTATSGSIKKTVSFDVVGSVVVNPVARDLTMVLSKTSLANSGGDSVDVVATAVDASRNAVAGIEVLFEVDSDAVLVPVNKITDANGEAKARVTMGAVGANRTVTVKAISGTLVRNASFKVVGAKLQATLQPATLKANERGQVEYTLTDVNSNPMVDVGVTVNGPGPNAGATGRTDGRGKYLYSYTAAGSGPTGITAEAGGSRVVSTVQIDAQLQDVPGDTIIRSATFTASPIVVNVNPVGAKDNRSELRLLFLSDKNRPVPNVRARIGFGANTSSTDGDISSGKDAVITSDANGAAVTSFISGQRPSPTDQVKVFACFAKNDTVEQINACPPERLRSVSLTVVEQPLSISIGTNGLVASGVNDLTYIQQFTVLVVDSAGRPKSDVELAPVIDLPSYYKGFWFYDKPNTTWVRVQTAQCLNEDSSPGVGYRNGSIEAVIEDLNGNGILDLGEDINGNGILDRSEDVNRNAQLDPRKSDVSISMVGASKTDANGLAVLKVEYPQSMGSWIEFSIKVSASGVVSPPAWTGRLAVEGDVLTSLKGIARELVVPLSVVKAEGDPPFKISPYGRSSTCGDAN